jgi:hypothetical protein
MILRGQSGEKVTFQVDLQDREDLGFDLFTCGELFRQVYVRYGEDVRRQVVSWNLEGGLMCRVWRVGGNREVGSA